MQLHSQSRRPSERTEQYFHDYLLKMACQPGDRLPSPRQIAAELDVSESTVRGVVRKWLEKGILRSRQGSGIFVVKPPPAATSFRLAANNRHGKVDSPVWSDLIHMSALRATAELGPKASCISLYSGDEVIDSLSTEAVLARCKNVDGFILYASDPHKEALLEHCLAHKKPYISLHPPNDESTSNFVSLANFSAFYKITEALLACGRRRFAILVYPEPQRGVAIRQRLNGVFTAVATRLGRDVTAHVISCPSFFKDDGYTALSRALREEGLRPDAVLCAGDDLALGAHNALLEHGLSIPGEVSLISGAGHHAEILSGNVTTMAHPFRAIGQAMIDELVSMLEEKRMATPGVFLPIGLRAGGTTSPAENERLLQAFAKCPLESPLIF